MSIQVLRTPDEASRYCEQARQEGLRIAFVPTMGYLHEGHLSLMREAASRCDLAVASIFVNPTQFGPKEDLGRYPRDLQGDLAKCEAAGVRAAFVPEPLQMYPEGHQTWVEVVELSRGLCGEKRPGHFRGVATIVSKLFNIIRPHLALFGEKDYQQLKVIEALARDLHSGVEVVGLPTVREANGLAMSSRNALLNPEDLQRAASLYRGLNAARLLVEGGQGDVRELVMAMRQELEASKVRVDYVEVVDPQTLRPLTKVEKGKPARALVAGFLGQIRLIDNIALGES